MIASRRPTAAKRPRAPVRAHAATVPTNARKPPPRAATSPPPAEPAQEQGATLPTVRREGPCLVACVDGLRGVVSRWECSASRMGGLVSFTRLTGAAAPVHARTVERHRAAVEAWMRRGPQ